MVYMSFETVSFSHAQLSCKEFLRRGFEAKRSEERNKRKSSEGERDHDSSIIKAATKTFNSLLNKYIVPLDRAKAALGFTS